MILSNEQTLFMFYSIFVLTIGIGIYVDYILSIKISKENIAIKQKKIGITINKKILNQYLKYIIIPFFLIFISFVRNYSVGTDTQNYLYIFHNLSDFTNGIKEPINYFVNYIIHILTDNYSIVILIGSIVTHVLIFKSIDYYLTGKLKYLSVWIYCCLYYLLTYNISRQLIALSIIFYGLQFILKKDLKKYLLCCLIATCIHNTAVICTVFYFVNIFDRFKIKQSKYLYYLFILILSFISAPLMSFILNKLIFWNNYSFSSTFKFGFLWEYRFVLILIFLVECNIIKVTDKNYTFLQRIFLITIPLRTLGYGDPVFMRIALFTDIIQILLIPLIIGSISNKKMKVLISILAIIFFAYQFYYNFYLANTGEVFPYILGGNNV